MPIESTRKHWKVSEVAERAHVTVRTLHHYDEIGLLVPSGRSEAGYRLYSEADLERLFRILLYRELGFPLEAIARVIDDPAMDRRTALRAQRELLVERRWKTDAVIRAVDRALETLEGGTEMSGDEILDGLEAFANAPEEVRAHQAEHAAEVKERWGGTEEYRESNRRVAGYTSDDWKRIREEAAAAGARMVGLLEAGADPEGEEAMAGAEALREHISRWFYPCSYAIHAGLADMYEADPRFTGHYEAQAPGLTAFIAAAIRANARRAREGGREE
jgi:DNA-binding transcriptional MerR regulator